MIEKIAEYEYGDNGTEVLTLVNHKIFTKTASFSQELLDRISKLVDEPSTTYALVNALSAGEFFGSNRNADYFPEESLKKHHKSFEVYGHVYKHHVNKDPQKSLGKVIFSHYNPEMHRVELILALDNEKAKDIIDGLNIGDYAKVSMGCKVPWDECSYCGNKAKNRNEYCDHLKRTPNQVLPGGRKVYAINWEPKFFDISIVRIPAEPTASIMKKITPGKLDYIDKSLYIKTAEFQRTAEIKKKVEATMEILPDNLLPLVANKIDNKTIEKLAEYPLNEVLSTFLGLRIFPTKEDFQKLALYSFGNKKLADELDKNKIVFEAIENAGDYSEISLNNFNLKIAEALESKLPSLSITKELVVARGLQKLGQLNTPWNPDPPKSEPSLIRKVFLGTEAEVKKTPSKNPFIPMGILGSLYYGYTKIFNDMSYVNFKGFLQKYPWVLPLVVGAGTMGSLAVQDQLFKQAGVVAPFLRNSLLAMPVSYLLAGHSENLAQKGIPISGTQDFIRKHPALTGLVFGALGTTAEKQLLKVANVIFNLKEDKLNQVYKDLLEVI